LKQALSLLPRSWSREKRSAVAIGISAAAMVLFLWALGSMLSILPDPIGPAAEQFAKGTAITVQLAVIAGLTGVLIGLLAALGKLSRFPPLRWLMNFYIWVARGTPLLVQIAFVFFAVPEILPIQLSDFNSGVAALAINVGAYNAEAVRAGILAIHKGQSEAARSLGLGPFQTFLYIVFPQSFRVALPSLVNNFVSLLKDTSLVTTIGVVELMTAANRVKAETYQPVPVLITAAVIYLALTTIMTQVSNALERQMDVQNNH
jgi:polar amino acid transport system permease protein